LILSACLSADTIGGLDISVRAAVEDGQIINGHYNSIDANNRYLTRQIPYRLWLHRGYINVRLKSAVSDRLVIVAEPEVRIWFNTYPSVMISGTHLVTPFRQYSYVGIADGEGIFSFFGNDDPRLRFAAGIFPVKYNPDAGDLGEYLFRTGAYVPYIINKFEYQFGRLTGFRMSSNLAGILQQDLLLHTETQVQPLHNWSVSYLAGARHSAFEAGAGVSFHHGIMMDAGTPLKNDPLNAYLDAQGDSAYYTFKGIKLMGRAAFDPKAFMPPEVAAKFGTKDLRIFAEAAVLGLKDYPAHMPQAGGTDTAWVPDTAANYYGTLSQRIPVMAGFNFPVCNLVDYLSFQVEYFGWPYKNVFYRETKKTVYAVPPLDNATSEYQKEDYLYDSWKWSLGFRKTLAKGFSAVGQVARNHIRHEFWQESQRDDEEALTRSNEWYWVARMQYDF
jgi:hypothetical protein